MKGLLAYANGLSRDFAQNHLAKLDSGLTIVTADSVQTSIAIISEPTDIEVAVLDMELPDMHGLSGLHHFKKACPPNIPLAITVAHLDQRMAAQAIRIGVKGILPYSMKPEALIAAVHLMAAGEPYVPVELKIEASRKGGSVSLTGRERDVLAGLRTGQSNREIARALSLSEVTVKHHIKSLRGKLGARNRVHAVCRAIELEID